MRVLGPAYRLGPTGGHEVPHAQQILGAGREFAAVLPLTMSASCAAGLAGATDLRAGPAATAGVPADAHAPRLLMVFIADSFRRCGA
jgi:hypothetical protein